MHARARHLNRVASSCDNALDEDVVIQADKGPEGLEGCIVEDELDHRVARLAARISKQAPVRMEDDDIASHGWPAPRQHAVKQQAGCTHAGVAAQRDACNVQGTALGSFEKAWAHRRKGNVIFSATSRSPMSKVGNMESEGMKRGSAMNLHACSGFLVRRAGATA